VEADPTLHGRILALQTFILGGSLPIGGPILGLIGDAIGARAPIVLGGVVCILAAIFGLTARRVRDAGRARWQRRRSAAGSWPST
jgi:uncharacterized membrane protein YhaH (DUF805 family)